MSEFTPRPANWWKDDEARAWERLRTAYELLAGIADIASKDVLEKMRASFSQMGTPEADDLVSKIDAAIARRWPNG